MSHPTFCLIELQIPDYRRYLVPGGTYFFTAVVHQQHPLFEIEDARKKASGSNRQS